MSISSLTSLPPIIPVQQKPVAVAQPVAAAPAANVAPVGGGDGDGDSDGSGGANISPPVNIKA